MFLLVLLLCGRFISAAPPPPPPQDDFVRPLSARSHFRHLGPARFRVADGHIVTDIDARSCVDNVYRTRRIAMTFRRAIKNTKTNVTSVLNKTPVSFTFKASPPSINEDIKACNRALLI